MVAVKTRGKSKRKAAQVAPSGRQRRHEPPPSSAGEGVFGPIPIFGRQEKPITRGIIERICRALRSGAVIEAACVMADVSKSQFFEWQAGARKRHAEGKSTPEDVEFMEALYAAKLVRALGLEMQMKKHAGKNYQACLAMLERLPETRERWRPPRVDVLVQRDFDRALGRLKKAFGNEPDLFERIISAIAGELGEGDAGGDAPGEGGPDHPAGGEAVQPAPAGPEAGGVAPA